MANKNKHLLCVFSLLGLEAEFLSIEIQYSTYIMNTKNYEYSNFQDKHFV